MATAITGTTARGTTTVTSGPRRPHGRFVFHGAGYAKKHVIVQADGASGLLHDTAVRRC
jgi:hypothetical protein